MPSPRSTLHNGLALIGFIILTFAAPAFGAFSPPDDWYFTLTKPSWNPPPWIFGPVWTTLYLMMATAAWRIWKCVGWKSPLFLYLIQLLFNAAWTPLFFGAHRIGWALVDIIALWIAILLTVIAFHRADRPAAKLLYPYLAWVSFATILNATLWHLNR